MIRLETDFALGQVSWHDAGPTSYTCRAPTAGAAPGALETMKDAAWRALERRLSESAFIDDECAYLLGRLRQGEFDLKELRLAAYCGSTGAQRLLDSELAPGDLERWWLAGLEDWGP